MRSVAPINPSDRFAVYRFFNGIAGEANAEPASGPTRLPLVKTFLLEHVSSDNGVAAQSPERIFEKLGARIRQIDDTFMSISAPMLDRETKRTKTATTGFLEKFDERFFAYYTAEDSVDAKKRVAKWVQSPDLDFTWFSSPLLQALWDKDVSGRGDHRFGKLVFRHDSIFEMPEDFSAPERQGNIPDPMLNNESEDGEERRDSERRRARFVMGDKVGRIRSALQNLQKNYDPLNVLHALRLPSRTGAGGHELWQWGQITNRTDSFESHRNTVRYLYRIYKSILDFTEQIAWRQTSTHNSWQHRSKGVPLIVKFHEPLSSTTFERWVQLAFQKRNRFKLWGDPIILGPTKVHVYGADRHLWQPINLEMTEKGIVAILPQGTCGNTFHRLVANIQQYVSPKIDAWIGSESFNDVVGKWPLNPEQSDGN